MDRVVAAISNLVGAPAHLAARRYFLVKTLSQSALQQLFAAVPHESFELKYTYLRSTPTTAAHAEAAVRTGADMNAQSAAAAAAATASGGSGGATSGAAPVPFDQPLEQRLECRSGNSGSSTYLLRSRVKKGGKRIELQRPLSASEYNQLSKSADTNRLTVQKVRRVFVARDLIYEFDTFIEPKTHSDLMLLTVEVEDRTAALPPFPPGMEIVKEVTNDWRYESTQLSAQSTRCEDLS